MLARWIVITFCVSSFVLTKATWPPDVSSPGSSRAPRCIVVQKQSGSKDSDDYDEDSRGPTPKGPRINKLTAHTDDDYGETEELKQKFGQFKIPPAKWFQGKILSKFIGL